MALLVSRLKNCLHTGILEMLARVVKWHTRYLEVVVPQGVEVRLLSRAPKLTFSEMTAPSGLAPALRKQRLDKVAHLLFRQLRQIVSQKF